MKVGVSSYSFQRLLDAGAFTHKQLICKAKEMGFDCIEFSGFKVPEGRAASEVAAELREESERVGLPVASYTISGNLLSGCNGNLQEEIDRLCAEVDIAKILGAPSMRHDAAWGEFPHDWIGPRTFEAALPRMADGCRAVTQYAASKGIRTMVENHGFFCQESQRVERLYNAVAHPNFGLLLDLGNFLCANENPSDAVGRLKNFAFHCHAKDFYMKSGKEIAPGRGWWCNRGGDWLRGTVIGYGVVPVAQCVRTLVTNGYDGVFSVEFEGGEDVLEGIEIGRENLLRFIELAKA